MAHHKSAFFKRNFKLHVDMLQKGKIAGGAVPIPDSAVHAPPQPRYESWRCLVHPAKLRFSVRAEVERGPSFEWQTDQHFLEREIDRLFSLGCAGVDGLLDVDSFRVVVHALDPFELESNIAAMHREADVLDREAIDIHDFRSAMIWILSEDGIQFSPHFPKTVFVWVKMHRNGTIYCPYETRAEQTGHAPSHTHDWDLNRDSMHDEHTVRGEFAHDRLDGEESHEYPAQRRPMSPLTANAPHREALFSEFRTVTKALSNHDDKPKTGLRAVFGQQVGGLPVHKALTLALASKKVPLMKCLTKPVQSVEEARERKRLGGYTQAEIDAKRSAEQAAAAAREAALEAERETMARLRLQSRDRHGRRVLPAAHKEKEAKDVWQNDPLQVNKRLLFQGATRDNVRAFLAAKQVLSARTPRVSARGEAGEKGGGREGGDGEEKEEEEKERHEPRWRGVSAPLPHAPLPDQGSTARQGPETTSAIAREAVGLWNSNRASTGI